jgi:hypothetical protein
MGVISSGTCVVVVVVRIAVVLAVVIFIVMAEAWKFVVKK